MPIFMVALLADVQAGLNSPAARSLSFGSAEKCERQLFESACLARAARHRTEERKGNACQGFPLTHLRKNNVG